MTRRDADSLPECEAPPTPSHPETPTATLRMSPGALAGLSPRPAARTPSTVKTMAAAPAARGEDAAVLGLPADASHAATSESPTAGAHTTPPTARPSLVETIALLGDAVPGVTAELAPADSAAAVQDPHATVDESTGRSAELGARGDDALHPAQASPPAAPPSRPPLERNLALARLQSRMLGTPAAAVKVGRFIVIEKLGQGAMGIVYLAYDPKLDRRVALKLVDTSALGSERGDAQVRLEREAKAAASLGHPNVVTVYDVGTQGDEVFLAMEYVEGGSLSTWMTQAHGWRDTVRTFVEIARGLEAAHGAGLVHRDFKPDNVLIGTDGRPRVADFGLARPTEGWNLRDAQRVLEAPRGPRPTGLRSDALASTGEICGTPAYMAPEQFSGVDVTAAADQFGFCASLFEALFGYRPFAGDSVTELAIAVIENDRQKTPARHRVPASVVREVLRGLEPHPPDRHASMGALADRLESTLTRRTRNIALGAAALVGVLGVGLGAQASHALDEAPCDAAAHALGTTWTPQRRTRVANQIAAAQPSSADTILPQLDAFAEAWTAQRIESCEATRVRGDQADAVLALRTACLDRAQSRLDATLEALADRPSQPLFAAVPDALGDVAACEDVEALRLAWEGLGDKEHISAERRAAWTRATRLSTSLLLRSGAAPRQWASDAQDLTDLGETHHLPQAASEGHTFLARAALTEGDLETAQRELDSAFRWAVLGVEDTLPVVLLLQADVAVRSKDLPAAALLAKQAQGFAQRVREDKRRTRLAAEAELMGLEVESQRDNYAPVREGVLDMLGRPELREVPNATALRRRMTSVLGSACRGMGELPCAARYHEESLALARSEQNVEPLELAGRYANAGLIRADMGEGPAAVAHFETAVRIVEDASGPKHPMRGALLCDMGGITVALIDPDKGQRIIHQGLDVLTEALGEEASERVEPLIDLSRAAVAMGDLHAARAFAQDATAVVDASREPEHPQRAQPRIQRGQVERAAGHPQAAAVAFGEALTLLGQHAHPMQTAELRFDRAQALVASAGASDEARAEAQAALDLIAEFPPGKPLREAITQWRADALGDDFR